ncbi:hypothetical protein OIU34_07455 [Pararhizobium sp. BT-229]|uniref:hypothetical protein n=1 Tax=Pararhizobium sp. BT-229 TaxID=2986923 RepID=UPI0021F7F204|nr:hypothetical protein [Pararhizobium sp. BT-229]MCV9961737.1 hypothetical protein [Pararhizobium sp. BT-229]
MNIRASSTFTTEIEFTLPKGYLDQTGILHTRGVMRLATAADEILPLRDPRVQQNEAYLAIIVLARVITSLGDLPNVDTRVIEGLFASDLNFLQRLYERINGSEDVDQPADLSGLPGMQPQKGFHTVGEA